MKKISSLRVISAILFLAITSSCVGGKDQLEYENTPYMEYKFGKKDEISIQLPTSVLGDPYSLYSKKLRWEWVENGFIDYLTISKIKVTKEKVDDGIKNILTIRLNSGPGDGFIISREVIMITNGNPVMLTIMTGMYQESPYRKEILDRFVSEDNDLFEKILKSVRIKGQDGKLLKIKVDYDALKKRIEKIYFAPERPSVTIEIPYELIEAEPVAPVAEQAKVHSGEGAK